MRLGGETAYQAHIKPPNPYYAQNAQTKNIQSVFQPQARSTVR